MHATFLYWTYRLQPRSPNNNQKLLEEAGLNPGSSQTVSPSPSRSPIHSRLQRIPIPRRLILLGVLLTTIGLLVSPCRAEVTLPQVLSSHMVIQRDLPVHVWGWAAAGEMVSVSFRDQSQSTQATEWGSWSIYLPPAQAGGPFVMNIKASNSIKLDDVLVGDVWVASGQSNMEFQLRKAATAAADLPKTANAQIRLMLVKERTADYPQLDLPPTAWTVSSPDTAKDFSAVAWYFAREISEREHVPVGVIDSSVGGTIAESWTSLTALGEDASLAPIFATRGHMADREATELLKDKWRKRLQEEAKAQGKPDPAFPWHPPLNTWAPAMLFNAMIAPITPFPIRGVIWYQGESNSALERAPIYARLFKAMIEDWRAQWKIGDFPFLYVQLANFTSTPLEVWAPIREAQRRALVLRNTGMAVTIDIGNPKDVHPTDKLTVGLRLALAARSVAYGEHLEYSGPLFRQLTTEQSSLRIWFDHASTLETRGGPLSGFEVAGDDGLFTPASAVIDGNTVVLTSSTVLKPTAARYGWANSPECHLYNQAGLPASPFTSVR